MFLGYSSPHGLVQSPSVGDGHTPTSSSLSPTATPLVTPHAQATEMHHAAQMGSMQEYNDFAGYGPMYAAAAYSAAAVGNFKRAAAAQNAVGPYGRTQATPPPGAGMVGQAVNGVADHGQTGQAYYSHLQHSGMNMNFGAGNSNFAANFYGRPSMFDYSSAAHIPRWLTFYQ